MVTICTKGRAVLMKDSLRLRPAVSRMEFLHFRRERSWNKATHAFVSPIGESGNFERYSPMLNTGRLYFLACLSKIGFSLQSRWGRRGYMFFLAARYRQTKTWSCRGISVSWAFGRWEMPPLSSRRDEVLERNLGDVVQFFHLFHLWEISPARTINITHSAKRMEHSVNT